MARVVLIVIAGILVGGCASPSDKPLIPPIREPAKAAAAAAAPATPPAIVGSSVEHRPIELYSFGAVTGGRPVLVMGAIHGSEPTSADVSRGLLATLQKTPSLAGGVPVIIIPVANPDGLAAGTRVNAHHIDLNRNFPATNWSTRARRMNNFGGGSSGSEPETIALMQVIEQYQPRLIISVHSMDNPTNNYDGPAKQIAELMARYNGYPPTATIGYPTPGSLGSWAGIDRKIPMITLELPRSLPAAKAWPNNRDAVLAAIGAVK